MVERKLRQNELARQADSQPEPITQLVLRTYLDWSYYELRL